MADVGRLAGVSPTAVSFVINGRVGEISQETRDRVLDAVRLLGYRPNRTARGLRTRRSHTIGFVAQPGPPCGGRTIAGACDEAAERGSRLVLASVGGGDELRSAVEDLLDRQVDAILLTIAGGDPPLTGHVPTVLVGCESTMDERVACVLPDERAGARTATELLLTLGHRRIAGLGGRPALWSSRERLAGYRAALAAAGVGFDPDLVRPGEPRADQGYVRTRDLMRCVPRPTALLCGGERIAVGAYLALAAAGLRVPDDVSVLGYEAGPGLAEEIRPALSTVYVPFYEMGRRAVQRLLDGATDQARDYLPCPLVCRGSVAAPGTA